jgi:hypothetical protein
VGILKFTFFQANLIGCPRTENDLALLMLTQLNLKLRDIPVKIVKAGILARILS